MNINNKIVWAVTDGSEGMISQVSGLSQLLSNNVKNYKTDLIFPWSKLQPGYLPVFKWIFKHKINFLNKPDILITCGRKSVYFSLLLKKIFKKEIITIHIQDPKINSNRFDYVIAPNHDCLKGSNVINSFGAIHHITKKILDNCNDNIEMQYTDKIVSIIVGGQNRHYKFSKIIVKDLIKKIIKLKNKFNNYSFLVIGSRRTDKDIIDLLKNKLDGIAHVWNKKTKNPYLFALKNSNYFIVTSDSTSMISECAFTGKPIYVYHLPFKRISTRIESFHNEFENKKITRKFNNNLELWGYENLDEAKRIASILRLRILNS